MDRSIARILTTPMRAKFDALDEGVKLAGLGLWKRMRAPRKKRQMQSSA
jgi:hypothetical protein